MAYLWVLPAGFAILHKFGVRLGDLQFIITANEYIGFTIQIILAFGIMFQLPVVMTMMSAIGLIRPETFARHRPIALVIGAIFAALLTPPDVFSMMMMMAPLLLLYEVGIMVSRILVKRRA
jgi:sec-independent protein translocase protein TatC